MVPTCSDDLAFAPRRRWRWRATCQTKLAWAEPECSAAHRRAPPFGRAQSTDHHGGHAFITRFAIQDVQHLEAIDSGDVEVDEQQIRLQALHRQQSLYPVIAGFDQGGHRPAAQHGLIQARQVAVIFHHQHPQALGGLVLRCYGGWRFGLGGGAGVQDLVDRLARHPPVPASGLPGHQQAFVNPELHGTHRDGEDRGRLSGGTKYFFNFHECPRRSSTKPLFDLLKFIIF